MHAHFIFGVRDEMTIDKHSRSPNTHRQVVVATLGDELDDVQQNAA